MRWLCFLCTGNYYRSRYAEERFNFLARQANLDLRADSRALHRYPHRLMNPGFMSASAIRRLELHGIPVRGRRREPLPLTAEEVPDFTRFIALDQEEHEPLVERYFPDLAVDYWSVPDLDRLDFELACDRMDQAVDALIAEYRQH